MQNIENRRKTTLKALVVLSTFVILGIVAIAGCSEGDSRKTAEKGKETDERQLQPEILIVAVGDSLTAGYGVREEDAYPAQLEGLLLENGYSCRVVNAGISGETSSGARSRIEWVLSLEPDLVILETGANDGLRGIDPDLIERNIREILEILTRKEIAVLLTGMKMTLNLGPEYVRTFNAIYPRLARDFDIPFFPFFLEGVAMRRHLNQEDTIHPNREGYRIISENLLPVVVSSLQLAGLAAE